MFVKTVPGPTTTDQFGRPRDALPGANFPPGTTVIDGQPRDVIPVEVVEGWEAPDPTRDVHPVYIVPEGTPGLVPMSGLSAGPVSDIQSLTIMDAAGLDATGAYGDPTVRIGVDGSGWVARAIMPYLALQTFDPTKISILVSDPGNDEVGATTVFRVLTGTVVLRRQYTFEAADQLSNDGLTFTVYFALDDDGYENTTIVSATAAPGYYGGAQDGAIATTANDSVTPYEPALWGWYNLQQERATGPTFRVEGMAFHRRGVNGKMVPRVEYVVTDHTGYSETFVVTDTALATLQTQGNIGECYPLEFALANFAQGVTDADIARVNVRIFPWIGNNVIDLAVDGVAWPTIRPLTPLRWFNDKNGTYGGAFAYVKSGAVGGVVSLDPVVARATPFPTPNAALAALPAFNNANRGHNSHSGSRIRLMDDGAGGAVAHAFAASTTAVVAGACWTDFEPDPLNTAAVTVNPGAANRGLASLCRFKVGIAISAAQNFDGGNSNANQMLSVDGVTLGFTAAPGTPLNYRFGLTYFRNMTVTGATNTQCLPFVGFSTTRTQAVLVGVVATDASFSSTVQADGWQLFGCRLNRVCFSERNTTAVPNSDSPDGSVIYNNEFYATTAIAALGAAVAYPTWGFAVVQNVVERARTPATACVGFGQDGTLVPFKNGFEAYNTYPDNGSGIGRTNRCYNDVAGSEGVIKRLVSRFNLWGNYNCKADTFISNTTSKGRVGGWRNRFTVGHEGNVSITGSAGGLTPDPRGGSWLGERWPANSNFNAGLANVGFVNNQVNPAGSGGGNYRLTGAVNEAYNRVGAGRGCLKRDLAGNLRRTDGTGACGAYERTV